MVTLRWCSRCLGTVEDGDLALVQSLLDAMQTNAADYTNTFRALCDAAEQPEHLRAWRSRFPLIKDFDEWFVRWQRRVHAEQQPSTERVASMRKVNPAYIPRNHRVEEAIHSAVENGDLSRCDELLAALSLPYQERESFNHFAQPPAPSDCAYKTFCGT